MKRTFSAIIVIALAACQAPLDGAENRDLKKLGGRWPDFPPGAFSRGIEGVAGLGFIVTAHGEVRDIEVLESRPHPAFGEAATPAVSKWRYRPRRVDGVDVCTKVTILLTFCIDSGQRRRPRPPECANPRIRDASSQRVKDSHPAYADINAC